MHFQSGNQVRTELQGLRNTINELRRIVEIQMREIQELKAHNGLPPADFYPQEEEFMQTRRPTGNNSNSAYNDNAIRQRDANRFR